MADPEGERPVRRGPRGSRGVVRARIVAAALATFSASGFRDTSMRDIADAAGVDARTVAYYFSDRDALLAAVLQPPAWLLDDMGEVNAAPLAERGRALVQSLVTNWSGPEQRELMALILATSIEHPPAVAALREAYVTRFVDVLTASLDDPQAELRAGLAAGALSAAALTRFVLQLEPLASMPDADFVAVLAPTVQHYLDGDLALPIADA